MDTTQKSPGLCALVSGDVGHKLVAKVSLI